ncbi:late competence development ComFB family protein [Phormidium sp. LEGE 05292]|uniref:late competence development ComFB family protein n=1 Tax=[Phormidium] sp. LEGE 05292 TaxID=767427 RepID=UPI00187F5B02|nr:late competence development ComFB family protein [Phormidium sp. LEGE 05292]MBE9229304.1 late competence development ComFB family protein [Phormidium sp. LEGE 05292]
MGKQLFNLTLIIVAEEIEKILETYPKYPYKQIFAATGLYQDLVAYVLSRVPNKYAVVEGSEAFSTQMISPLYPTKQRLDIEYYIHQGVRNLMSIYNKNNFEQCQTQGFDLNKSFLVS